MKKQTFILSLGYWFSAYSLGLLLHPYKTMRELVRGRVFAPLTLVPMVVGCLFWVVGLLSLRFGWVILWVLGLMATSRFINLLAFLWWWMVVFLLLWQVVLLYLFLRFRMTTKRTSE